MDRFKMAIGIPVNLAIDFKETIFRDEDMTFDAEKNMNYVHFMCLYDSKYLTEEEARQLVSCELYNVLYNFRCSNEHIVLLRNVDAQRLLSA